MAKYRSREVVDARKVSTADGETVVTSAGPVHAPKGSYVVTHPDNGTVVLDADTFASQYEAKSGGRSKPRSSATNATKPAKKSSPPPPKDDAVSRAKARAAQRTSTRR